MSDAIQLEVTLLGREYKVACRPDEKAELLAAVSYLDSKMREIRDTAKVTGVEKIAVMAALNIADERSKRFDDNLLLADERIHHQSYLLIRHAHHHKVE